MAVWIKPSYEDIGIADAMSAVGEVADLAASILDPIQEVLPKIADAIEVVQILLAPNIWTTMGGAALQQIKSLIDNLIATDGYMYVMLPLEWSAVLQPHGFVDAVADLAASVKDPNDPNRPVADDNSAWAAVTILASASNWYDFKRMIDLFSKFFNGDELSKWKRFLDFRFNVESVPRVPRAERPNQGTPRDWSRAGVASWFPGLVDILQAAKNSLEDITQGYGQLAQGINELGDMIAERLAFYSDVVNTISEFATLLDNWRTMVPNLYVLVDGASSGGVGGYMTSMAGSSNPPDGLLTGGITFLATGPNAVRNVENVTKLLFMNLDRAGL